MSLQCSKVGIYFYLSFRHLEPTFNLMTYGFLLRWGILSHYFYVKQLILFLRCCFHSLFWGLMLYAHNHSFMYLSALSALSLC